MRYDESEWKAGTLPSKKSERILSRCLSILCFSVIPCFTSCFNQRLLRWRCDYAFTVKHRHFSQVQTCCGISNLWKLYMYIARANKYKSRPISIVGAVTASASIVGAVAASAPIIGAVTASAPVVKSVTASTPVVNAGTASASVIF